MDKSSWVVVASISMALNCFMLFGLGAMVNDDLDETTATQVLISECKESRESDRKLMATATDSLSACSDAIVQRNAWYMEQMSQGEQLLNTLWHSKHQLHETKPVLNWDEGQ